MNIEVVFHVFTHDRDLWTENLAMALLYYKRWKKLYRCARLYIEVYEDRVNDVMLYENCLLSVGDFPQ
jgi:hypothetical protein